MKKYHIVALNGSNASNSTTFRLTYHTILNLKKLLEQKNDVNVTGFITNYRDLQLIPCTGCKKCFYTGKCFLDNDDFMYILRKHLEVADCIIFSSPVYENQIPGTMKCVIDRLGFWIHLLRLANKCGFVMVNSYGSGLEQTSQYLLQVMTHLGVDVRKKYTINTGYNFSKESVDTKAQIIARDMYNSILEKDNNSNELLYRIFETIKEKYVPLIIDNVDQFEVNYWRRRHLDKMDTYEEYLDSLK